MSTKINVRSPYYIKTSNASLSYATLKLYIYEGVLTTDKPALPQYTITKTELSTNNYVVFEIAELVRDYLENSFSGTYATDMVWVEADITQYNSSDASIGTDNSDYLACDGYGYFEDGINPNLSRELLQSNLTIFYNEGEDIHIPYFIEDVTKFTFSSIAGVAWDAVESAWEVYDEDWGGLLPDITPSADNGDTDQKIRYLTLSSSENFGDGDQINIIGTSGTTTITLEEVCEPKFTPYKVVFYNKFGALQDMWFFKKGVTSINAAADNYKANTLNLATPTYSISAHQIQSLNKNGSEVIRLSSGFYNEDYNEVVRQLILSEQVWIDNGTDVLPVNVNTNSYTFQTSVNDKLIQHSLEFEYAFDKINNVR